MEVDDNSVVVKLKPITYDHESIYYIPVFQKNFDEQGNPLIPPTFEYNMTYATTDEQMAASFEPDYIFELKGHFKATTKPIVIKGE